jgi:hypothetical protein
MCSCRIINREIIGFSIGQHKTVILVKQAFQSVNGNLNDECRRHFFFIAKLIKKSFLKDVKIWTKLRCFL